MARHRAASASNKHKSSSKDKHKKHTKAVGSSGSSKPKSKRVSFEEKSSDVKTNGSSSNETISHRSTKSNTPSDPQDLKHSSSKQYRNTSENSKHRHRPVPSIKSPGSSCTIQSPIRQKARTRDKPKEKEVHPYAASFSGLYETDCVFLVTNANAG